MKKAFVLIFSCLVLFLHFNIVKTESNKDESFHHDKLINKNHIKSKNADYSKKKTFLQFKATANEAPCIGYECFCMNYYDLTLILDESASIKLDNWVNKVVPFTSEIIENLSISENEVHVGIVLFGIKSRDYVKFNENIKYKKEDLLKKVDKLKSNYGNVGGTYIIKALEYSMKNYTKNKNSRPDAPKVTILFTDGNDNVAKDKQLYDTGLSYRKENVKLLVIGVSKAIHNKLKLIAGCEINDSCPFAMKVEWANLNDITKLLTDKICNTGPITDPKPDHKPCNGDECFCDDYYDLTLILDESASIGSKKWKSDVVPFAEEVINNLSISKDKIHAGVMRFAIYMKTDVSYDQEARYMKNDLIKIIRGLKDKYGNGGGTHIVEALEYSLTNFTKHPNNRIDAPKVTILFTDGSENSRPISAVRDIGLLYRRENIKLLVLGVHSVDINNLKLLAGCKENTDCPFAMKAEWDELKNISKIFTDKICNTGPVQNPDLELPVSPPNFTPCSKPQDCYCMDFYDLTLVLDESASISDYRWKKEVVPFSEELIKNLNISFSKIHVGVMLFAEYNREFVRFSDKVSYEKENLQKKIKELQGDYIRGKKSHIINALSYALTYYSKYPGRPEAPKVTLLFTDGYDSDQSDEELYNVGLLYRKNNVKLLVIGVSMANENKLKLLVACNQTGPCPYVIKTEWINLKSLPKAMIEKICVTGPVLPPHINPPTLCKGDECFCHNYYDLTLILDESASIGHINWKEQVAPFTEEIVKNLKVSENEVHIGIFLFAQFNRDFVKFSEEESYKKNILTQKVENLKNDYKEGGYTYIVEALEYGLQNYTKDPSSRSDASKVTILFTDGNNTNPSEDILINISSMYKNEQVKLLVLGVGNATIYKLRLLGGCHKTNGDCPTAIKIDWNNLKDISALMIDKVCNTDKPSTIPQTCVGDECLCKDYFDLTFIGVPSKQGNNKLSSDIIPYAEHIINSFNIDEQHVHVAISIYLGSKTIQIGFDDVNSYNKKELLMKIRKMDNIYAMSKTNIAHALEMGLKQSFGNGNREKAPKVTLLLTNSDNDISEEGILQQVSNNYIDKQVKLIIIGLGKLLIDKLIIAGGCSLNYNNCPNVLQSTDSSFFSEVEDFLKENICNNNVDPVIPPAFSCDDPLCEECDDDLCDNNTLCKKALDIAIVLDQSRNISNEQWKTYVKPFAINTVKQNYLSKYRTHITIVKMRKHTKEKWSLNKKISYKKNKIIKKINKLLMSPSNYKNIADTFKHLRTKVFTKTPKYKKKLIIMLVEGKSNTSLNDLRREIELLKINKIDLFVYAINNIDDNEYKILGNCEKSTLCENIVKVSWDSLLSDSDTHMNYICNNYPDDAECNEWDEWSKCPETCDNAMSKRERKGPYTLKGEGFIGEKHGNSCIELGSLEYRPCPIKEGCNDICGDFGEWSQCSATCGDGIRIRERENSLDSEECKIFNKTEIESCNIQDCDNSEICEEIGEWGEWSSCSKTCGYSTKERMFIILPEYVDKYPDCKYKEQVEIDVCSVPKCDDEKCFEWGIWGEWSASCGQRKRVQRANLNIDLSNINYEDTKSNECKEYYRDKVEYDETIPCPGNSCGNWTEWSTCDRTCNVGVRMRHFVSHVSGISGDDIDECIEQYNDIETEACLDLPLCDTGDCDDWETWIDCKEEDTCHKSSKRILTRKAELLNNKKKNTSEFCNDFKLFREEECSESNKPCNDALCNEWEEWGDCSATCGTSFKIRKRKEPLELIPPSKDINGNMGLTCEQQNIKIEEREACDTSVCSSIINDTPNGTHPNEGENKDDSNKKKGFGTGEKVSLAAGVIGLIALATGGLIYGYNTFNGGEIPDNSNMEFENVENNVGEVDETNEDFEVIDANDPMWN
ncbi:circumsporozoite-and TRAP-related protein, putative [Plasmodium gallinaceum]|uniref:Circumsporozoite-and TRAP-related protein, putative n=2 Tax=Plasmodium gallinaceum TaxID=5849 RepID=A0A1J1GTD3_PLAGA|nr:circumsporozoite-and TRAP-related protein, putative [Plasmodium gallinaceum]CRG94307.1 circumsporozoite-and TRAP-related protein, putative [Plasmodium gallinaceum]